MFNFKELVLREAVSTAWLNPHVDRQYTLKPSQITPDGGASRIYRLPHTTYWLPSTNRKYVLFEIGQIDPSLLGVEEWITDWTTLSSLCGRQELIINMHINHRMLLLSTAYIKRTTNHNTIIAVDYLDNKELLDSEYPMYIRFYSNAWYTTATGSAAVGTEVNGMRITSAGDASTIIAEANTKAALPGQTMIYHNGVYVSALTTADVAVGDYVEWAYDSSGTSYADVPITDMPHFESSLDSKRKYLCLAQDNARMDQFEFYDDVEIYVCNTEDDAFGTPRTAGVYYSRINASDIRMVTHRDYSIDSNRLSTLIGQQDGRIAYTGAFLRIFYRNAYGSKTVPSDANNIDDMYLTDRETRKMLMVGGVASIPQWQAARLEASPYIRWIGISRQDINFNNLRGVFSWHGMYAITQTGSVTGTNVSIPPVMEEGGKMYRFTNTGELKDVVDITAVVGAGGVTTVPADVTSVMFVPGNNISSIDELETTSNQTNDTVSSYDERRYFRRSGQAWQQARTPVDFNYNLDGTVSWSPQHEGNDKVKRNAGLYHSRDIVITENDISKAYPIVTGGGFAQTGLPMGRLDIWINGKRGIRGLDYTVDYPNFRVINRGYYTDGTAINVHLLYWGLSPDEGDPEFGFIKHRLLNYNTTYDVTKYRFKDIFIEGMRALPSELAYSEDRSGTMDARFREGAPYTVERPIGHVPTAAYAGLVESREESIVKEKAISDYLTIYAPEAEITTPVVIPSKHAVVSTLMHKLIEDISAGTLVLTNSDMSEAAVGFVLSNYRAEVAADITNRDLDWDFIVVHPSGRTAQTTVTSLQYSFLQAVNRYRLRDRVILTTYLNVV